MPHLKIYTFTYLHNLSRPCGIFTLALLLLGCTIRTASNKPLPPAKMEKVLWDLIHADQYVQQYLLKDSAKRNIKSDRLQLYQDIFHINKITKDQFQNSFDYYKNHPEKLLVIIDSLSSQANRRLIESYKPSS